MASTKARFCKDNTAAKTLVSLPPKIEGEKLKIFLCHDFLYLLTRVSSFCSEQKLRRRSLEIRYAVAYLVFLRMQNRRMLPIYPVAINTIIAQSLILCNFGDYASHMATTPFTWKSVVASSLSNRIFEREYFGAPGVLNLSFWDGRTKNSGVFSDW